MSRLPRRSRWFIIVAFGDPTFPSLIFSFQAGWLTLCATLAFAENVIPDDEELQHVLGQLCEVVGCGISVPTYNIPGDFLRQLVGRYGQRHTHLYVARCFASTVSVLSLQVLESRIVRFFYQLLDQAGDFCS